MMALVGLFVLAAWRWWRGSSYRVVADNLNPIEIERTSPLREMMSLSTVPPDDVPATNPT